MLWLKETGKLEGVPELVKTALAEAGLTEEQVLANPELAKDILYKLDFDDVMKSESSVKNISSPVSHAHRLSITLNPHTGKFEGIPEPIMKWITERGLTPEQIAQDSKLAEYVVEQISKLNLDDLLKDCPPILDISQPMSFNHNFSIKVNAETGKLEGVPEVIKEALAKAGLTEEQVLKNPELAKDILASLNPDDLIAKPSISQPTSVSHNFSIKFNAETGKFEGIPEAIRQAILEAGLTEEQVMKNPELAKDILYKFSLEDVLKGNK